MAQDRAQIRWGIAGVGLAGRARAKAIIEDERCHLVGVHRGRFASDLGVPNLSFEDLTEQVDAVAVCSPNTHHAAQARQALEAGCHTLVEFPLAETAQEASDLFDLAEAKGLILHVEHIELLLAAYQTLQHNLSGRLEVSMHMTKKGSSEEDVRSLFGATVARLHNLCALRDVESVGSVRWTDGRLEVGLQLLDGEARLVVESGPSLSRQTELKVRDDQALWTIRQRRLYRDDQEVHLSSSSVPLFAQDHALMMGRLIDHKPAYVSSKRILDVLRYFDAISASVGEEP